METEQIDRNSEEENSEEKIKYLTRKNKIFYEPSQKTCIVMDE